MGVAALGCNAFLARARYWVGKCGVNPMGYAERMAALAYSLRAGFLGLDSVSPLARPHAAEAAKRVWLTGVPPLGFDKKQAGQPPLSGNCFLRSAARWRWFAISNWPRFAELLCRAGRDSYGLCLPDGLPAFRLASLFSAAVIIGRANYDWFSAFTWPVLGSRRIRWCAGRRPARGLQCSPGLPAKVWGVATTVWFSLHLWPTPRLAALSFYLCRFLHNSNAIDFYFNDPTFPGAGWPCLLEVLQGWENTVPTACAAKLAFKVRQAHVAGYDAELVGPHGVRLALIFHHAIPNPTPHAATQKAITTVISTASRAA